VSDGLQYRDLLCRALVDHLTVREALEVRLRTNWIYIQEPDVLVGRLQIFNNWKPYMVADPARPGSGWSIFATRRTPLMEDGRRGFEEVCHFFAEVEKIGILQACDVTDAHVVRVLRPYPAYFGTYDRFHVIREFLDRYHNLYLVGRKNGMHKYNNQDHPC